MTSSSALATAASRLGARLQENLSEAARDFGFNNGLDFLASGASKHLEPGALTTNEAHKETKRLLESPRDKEREEGLRRVLALLCKGRPVASYFPLVTSCLSSSSFNVRSLVAVYILRQAQVDPDLALMSVNMYQKDLNDPNPAVRAMALRVLSGMSLEAITGLVVTSLKRSSHDTNWFVRKTVAACLVQLWHQDETHLSSILPILSGLLSDKSALVTGSAVATFDAICPDHLEFLHQHYRHLCRSLLDADEWGQTALIAALSRYARRNLKKPSEEQDIDSDLELLLKSAEPLLQSRNPAVAMSVVRLIFHLAPSTWHSKTLKPLIRHLHVSPELQEVILSDLAILTSLSPDLFSSSVSSFFLRSSDSSASKSLKLQCLVHLVSPVTIQAILPELQLYAKDADPQVAGQAIKAIGVCAVRQPEVAVESFKALLGFLQSRNDGVISQTIVVLQALLEAGPQNLTAHLDQATVTNQLVQYLVGNRISDSRAKASVYYVAGHQAGQVGASAYGPDLLRLAAKNFVNEVRHLNCSCEYGAQRAQQEQCAKIEIVNLAAKLVLLSRNAPSSEESKTIWLLFEYITTLARYDQDYALRDRARFLKGLLVNANIKPDRSLAGDPNDLESFNRGEAVAAATADSSEEPLLDASHVQAMLFKQTGNRSDLLPSVNVKQFGSFSLLAGKELLNTRPLPEWTKSPTPASLRDAESAPTTATPSPRSLSSSQPNYAGPTSGKGNGSPPIVLTPSGSSSSLQQPRRAGVRDLNSFLAESDEEESSEEESDSEEESSEEETETSEESEEES